MSVGFPERKSQLDSLDEVTVQKYKRDYAYYLLKHPTDAFKAALEIFPFDNAAALRVSNLWPLDPEVRTFKKELEELSDECEFLPTKNDFLKKVWDKLSKASVEDSDFVKLADLYAKIREFYPEVKKESSVNIIGDCAKVMLVTSSATDEEWEQKVLAQQQRLLNGS